MTFNDFNLDPKLLDGLLSMGYSKPTPIQEQAIPMILEGKDLIACAQTGTGKTAAFVLPILHKILNTETRHLNTLILSPTRELAVQIDQQIEGFSYFIDVSSIPVYGGGSGAIWDQQRKAMQQGADIVIATPGRLLALLQSGEMKFTHLKHLILDEADRMLDMGFFDDIMKIVNYLPTERQTILFSATMPPKIRVFADRILKDPVKLNIAISKPAEGILQQAYVVHDAQKMGIVKHVLLNDLFKSVIIFASTKDKVKALEREMQKAGFQAKGFQSDLEQNERESILREFKSRSLRIIIGTDILSRGIDVEGINLVINYDTPPDPEDYIHRIGRTARADTTGTAITFINEKDQRKFSNIENLIGVEIPKLKIPEELGEGPVYDPGLKRPTTGNKKPWGKKPNKSGFRNSNSKPA